MNLIDKNKQIILKTERLYFRPFVEADLEMLYELYSDPETIKPIKTGLEVYMGNITKTSINNMMQHYIEEQKKYGFSKWAAFEKETGEFIGRIGLSSTENPNKCRACRLKDECSRAGYKTDFPGGTG